MKKIHKVFIFCTVLVTLLVSPLFNSTASAARLNPYPPSNTGNTMSCNPNFPAVKNHLPPCNPYVGTDPTPTKPEKGDDTDDNTNTSPTNPVRHEDSIQVGGIVDYHLGKNHSINLASHADDWEIKIGSDVISINEYGTVTSNNYGTAVVYFYYGDGTHRVFKITVEPYKL